MAWASSKIFRAYLADALGNVSALDADANAHKVALYNNSITPDQDAAAASTAYNTGQWATANEQFQAGQWAQGGVTLGTQSLDRSVAGTVFFDGADTASGSAATLSNVFGCLVYDTVAATVANQGVCFNYFGGTQSVSAGTFTIVWAANGIYRFTL